MKQKSKRKGYNNRVSCTCEETHDFKDKDVFNNNGAIKRVGDNCRCNIGTSFKTDKAKKTFAVFVQKGDPEGLN